MNFALGSDSLRQSQSDSNNVAVGTNALQQLGNAGAGGGNNTSNIAIGFGALGQVEIGNGNVAVGFNTLSNVVPPHTATANIVIGNAAGQVLGTAFNISGNVFIGDHAGSNITGGNSNTYIGGYRGPATGINRTIAFSDGEQINLLDMNLTTFAIWSMNYNISNAQPVGLHIYNFQDALASTANYERGVVDWNVTANAPMSSPSAPRRAAPVPPAIWSSLLVVSTNSTSE